MPTVTDFEDWRVTARRYLAGQRPPHTVHFRAVDAPADLFADLEAEDVAPAPTTTFVIAKSFVELARMAAYHRDHERWDLLYRTLWRLTHGEPHLLEIATDDDVARLQTMVKSVRRDEHKMHAFVRFRKVENEAGEHFVAWHRPDHPILRLTAPFFARRFPSMNWSILTPDESVTWVQADLCFGPGVPASQAPPPDMLEELWKSYYASTFNPARIKLAMMRREMPVRHWPTLPETALIPELLAQASTRVQTMIARQEGSRLSAADFLPPERDLPSLKIAAASCRGCELCQHATQTVFGEGPATAAIVLVGEQPGDQEDLAGRAFVGPAGAVLDAALADAGIDRAAVYVTNAVKHFKYEPRGKARLHKKPNAREVSACKPWVLAELAAIRPSVLVCLGATAAQALIGRDFRILERRGEVIATEHCRHTIATYHPAAILRTPNDLDRTRMRAALTNDLRIAASIPSR